MTPHIDGLPAEGDPEPFPPFLSSHLIEEVRFASDSPVERAVYCELVSETGLSEPSN